MPQQKDPLPWEDLVDGNFPLRFSGVLPDTDSRLQHAATTHKHTLITHSSSCLVTAFFPWLTLYQFFCVQKLQCRWRRNSCTDKRFPRYLHHWSCWSCPRLYGISANKSTEPWLHWDIDETCCPVDRDFLLSRSFLCLGWSPKEPIKHIITYHNIS